MTAIRELTATLIKAGMDPADAAVLVARAGAEFAVAAPSKAALRTRKWRANQTSQNVTGDDSVTFNESVTERHKTSPVTLSDDASLSQKERIESKEGRKRETTRGSRLPDGWTPTPQDLAVACQLLTEPKANSELEKFRDHWAQQPGARGVKLDWNAAWRNWTRRSAEYSTPRNGAPNGRRTVHDAANDLDKYLQGLQEPAPDGVRLGEGQDPLRLLPPR